MSVTEPQTPVQEVTERLAEHVPARTVPFLIALDNMRSMFSLKQQKDREDYAIQKRALGVEDVEVEPEEMGDISVAGDTTTIQHIYPTESKPAEAGKEAPSLARKLLPLATAAALGAGGIWLYDNLGSFDWPGVPDTSYEIRFYNSDGELIEVPRKAP